MRNKYDGLESNNPAPREPCDHTYLVTNGEVQTKYSPGLCALVIEHGQLGYLIEGFPGKYNVCMDAFCNWLSEPKKYTAFNSAVKVSVSACIHYWNCELVHAIEIGDWQAVTVIKGILSDITKSIPKELRENLFNNLHQPSAEQIEKEKKENLDKQLMADMTGASVDDL